MIGAEIFELRKGVIIRLPRKGGGAERHSLNYTEFPAICWSIIKYLLLRCIKVLMNSLCTNCKWVNYLKQQRKGWEREKYIYREIYKER